MKQTIYLYIFLLIACRLLVGCSDEDVGSRTGNPVDFGSNRTGSNSGIDHWLSGDCIGIFMVKSGERLSTASVLDSANNVEFEAQNNENASSSFQPVGTPIYFPVDVNQKVDFIAYYPYKTSLNDYIYPVDVSSQDNPADIDVLYSDNARGMDKYSGEVDLQFYHVLSKLSFTLTSGDGSPSLTGARVEVTNLATTADIDLTDGTLQNRGSQGRITANSSTLSIIAIPQTINNSKLIVMLADQTNEFEYQFPSSTEFVAGKNHQYTITVSKTGIKVSTDNITDWAGTDEPATPGTAEQM